MKIKLAGFAILLFAFSCREKNQIDVKPPTVESLTINGDAENHQTVNAGSVLEIDYAIKDNSGLESCLFSIHPANDGHTHTGNGSTGGEQRLTSGNWSFQETNSASGTSYSNQHTLQVPDSIGGVWHVEVTAKDDIGYKTSKVVSLNVANSHLPSISIVTCSPEISNDGFIYAAAGSSVSIVAMAHDTDNLNAVYIRLIGSSGNTISQQNIPVSGSTVTFGPVNYQNSLPGEYRIVIDAFDLQGYHSVWDTRLKVQ